jgi:hypothetical protein
LGFWLRLLEAKKHLGQFHVVHVPTTSQLADIMTKGLLTASFESFRSSLGIISNDASTAGDVNGNNALCL